MADRSVKVRLEANVQGFVSGMRTAVQATEDFAKRANGAGEKGLKWVDNHRQSINDVSNGFLGAGAVLTGFSAIAVKSAADFDQAMSSVQAATMAPAEEMELLRQAAIEAGASTKYSATEAAAGIEELAKAGVATADILNGGLAGALDLAASGEIGVGEAAEYAASAMTQFGLGGEDVTHIADLLAAGAGKAQGGVTDLGGALSQAGLVASQFGLSIEETVGGLSAFASAGLLGSDAGTSFKSMLQRLSAPSGKAAEEMETLGINAYDAQGNFVGLSEFAGQLQTAMQDLTPEARNSAMSIIFGSDAVRAANVLYSEGEAGIREWITAVDDQGFAAEQAAMRMDNLKGDLEELGGAFETALIGAGDGGSAALRPVVQGLTEVINMFNDLSPTAQSALGIGTGIAGLSLLAVGGLGKALTATSDLKLAMDNLGFATDTTGKKLKLLGVGSVVTLAITGLAFALSHFVSESAEARANADALAGTFDQLTGAATASTDTMILEQLNDHLSAGDWDQLEQIGYSYGDVVNAIKQGGPAYDQLWQDIERTRMAANSWTEAGREQSGAMNRTGDALRELGPAYQQAAEQQEEMAAGQEEVAGTAEIAAEQQEVLATAIGETGVTLEGVIEDMQKFLELLFDTGLATMSARDAQSAYQEALVEQNDALKEINKELGGLGEALNENKTDFDLTTEAGRTANSAFQEIARSGMDVVTSMDEAGASQEELQGALNTTYEDLIAAAGEFGITGTAAEELARSVLGVPDGISIETWMSDEAERQAGATQRAINGIDRYIEIVTQYVTRGTRPPVGNRGAPIPIAANADGNVYPTVKAFADGSEHHVAQIAPAGAWRLWAEPETGGEAYIPLALSKRARSERILADVANRFGMGLQKFDNGGMVMPYEPRRHAPVAAAAAPARMPFAPIITGPDAHAVAREAYSLYRHEERLDTAEL